MENKQKSFARYEEESNTIRKVPENYCLIAFDEIEMPLFEIDSATLPYRDRVQKTWEQWEKSREKSKDILALKITLELEKFERLVNAYAGKFLADQQIDSPLTDKALENAFQHCVIPADKRLYEPIKRNIIRMRDCKKD